jgi:hypothetical protein
MDEVLLSTSYFPNIQYFTNIVTSRQIAIEAHEHYQRQSYRNRCHIYGANGMQTLSVPVEKHAGKTKITDIRIAYHTLWQLNHWRSIRSAYENSAYFEYFSDYFEPLFHRRFTFLWDLNNEILEILLKLLKINPNIIQTPDFQHKHPHDCRNSIHPKSQYAKLDCRFVEIHYHQVFADKHGFLPNLSILDTLFCEGQGTTTIIKKSIKISE